MYNKKSVRLIASCVLTFIVLGVSNISIVNADDDIVNLYSARKEKLIKPLLDKFTQETGIRVNLVTGKADLLLKRLEAEGKNTPADVLITTDAGRLFRAKEAGLLQPITSDVLMKAIPEAYRDKDNYWFGLSVRARTIVYVKDKVDPKQLSTYEALADPQWKGKVCIRSSNNIYNQSLVASLIADHGEEQALSWAKSFVNNFAKPPRGGDRDQIKAAAAGICDVAVVNTYYLATMIHNKKDAKQREAADKVAVFWPNQNDRGAHVNISGAAITKNTSRKANAIKLLEFLVSDDSQQWYAESNFEYPVKPNVAWSHTLKSWGMFKADNLNMTLLGENNHLAVKLMDHAGWK